MKILAFCVKNGDKIKAETANTILKMKNLSTRIYYD